MKILINLHGAVEKLLANFLHNTRIALLPLSDTLEMNLVALADRRFVEFGFHKDTCTPLFKTEFDLKLALNITVLTNNISKETYRCEHQCDGDNRNRLEVIGELHSECFLLIIGDIFNWGSG